MSSAIDNILTSKFRNRSIHFKIKHNGVKLIFQNVQFAMFNVCKAETRNTGMTSS